ncbi:alpha/beta fold hydrolase [Kineococcus sp. DHX-1]|uniref:alpha/beta fold hydrolase n=1 Tax=Kineococcus sp. DHX-1 TaxID=3349638 RepID=UPI0036D403C0
MVSFLATPPSPGGPASGVVDVDGVRLAWTRSGPRSPTRPSLVLAHGLTDSADTWRRVGERLAQSHDVVRYDARGHGSSDRTQDYSAEAHTRDLVGVVRALGLNRPVLVGHSMGGIHATLAARELAVRALVLEDPAWPQVPQDGSKDVADSRRRVVEVAGLTEDERRAVGRARHPSWHLVDVETWSRAQTRLDPDVVGWFRSWRTRNAWRGHVSGLDVPGLLLIGDAEPAAVAVLPGMADEARRLWPLLQVEQVDGAAHDVRRDRFDAFARALTGFLAGLDTLGP